MCRYESTALEVKDRSETVKGAKYAWGVPVNFFPATINSKVNREVLTMGRGEGEGESEGEGEGNLVALITIVCRSFVLCCKSVEGLSSPEQGDASLSRGSIMIHHLTHAWFSVL